MEKIQYIVEKKIFIVDGQVIHESDLTPQAAAELKSKAEKAQVICG